MVLVKEGETTWGPLMSTDAGMEVREIWKSYGIRFGIEEVWCWGKQELRLLESNESATAMNMLLYGMTELSTWDRSALELVGRRHCPWDDASRRPSYEDRRKYLRYGILANEFNAVLNAALTPRKIIPLLKKLLILTP